MLLLLKLLYHTRPAEATVLPPIDRNHPRDDVRAPDDLPPCDAFAQHLFCGDPPLGVIFAVPQRIYQ